MRRDTEVGAIVTAEDVKEEGVCGNGESGAGKIGGGEPGGVGEHGKAM